MNIEEVEPNKEVVVESGKFPVWLHSSLPKGRKGKHTHDIVRKGGLATVCEEAKCPNRKECWSKSTATFLALGTECTRKCGFCSIDFSKTPTYVGEEEPEEIAKAVMSLGLKHVVVTMVTRDDLSDGGALHMSKIVSMIRQTSPNTTIELLVSDFQENFSALDIILDNPPEIFNHNLETVRELTPKVRYKATYSGSLNVLKYAAQSKKVKFIKSGVMLGLGETRSQVETMIEDLCFAGCHIITIGQYLRSTRKNLAVKRFVQPEEFDDFAVYGQSLGVPFVYSGAFVRSSYNAHNVFMLMKNKI